GFLRKVQANNDLAERVKRVDSYALLAQLSEEVGEPATADDLRSAFTARNAGVLAYQMMRRGLMDTLPMPVVPAMDPGGWKQVVGMDLEPVVTQLVQNRGWSAERASAAERRYRRFFYLKATLPANAASPTPEVDEFWHEHIINTQRYRPDCQRVAGRFLHH